MELRLSLSTLRAEAVFQPSVKKLPLLGEGKPER